MIRYTDWEFKILRHWSFASRRIMNSDVPYLPDCPWKKKWEGVVNFKVNLWNQSLMNDK